jgi:hypothetical protein
MYLYSFEEERQRRRRLYVWYIFIGSDSSCGIKGGHLENKSEL